MKRKEIQEKQDCVLNVRPILCEKSEWYKMGIYVDDDLCGYVQWIENSSHPYNFCAGNTLELARPIAEKLNTAESMCLQVNEMIKKGDII